jgi:hypothetical protein
MNIKDYIQGKRHGKEANRLERQAQENPFLHDAIDGFDNIAGNHLSAIENLEKELDKRLQKPTQRKVFAIKWQTFAIAASFTLLIGIGSLFLFRFNPVETYIVESNETPFDNENEILTADILQDSDLQNELSDIQDSKPVIAAARRNEQKIETAVEENEEIILALSPPPPAMAVIIAEDAVFERAAISISTEIHQPRNESMIVRGKVLDEFGEPSIGATIILGNSTIGTVTDYDGNFTLTIPEEFKDKNITVSYIGYQTQQLVPKQVMTIKMQADLAMLSEVVVTGMGMRSERRMFTGATESISAERIKITSFGEKEFESLLKENINKSLCSEETIEITLRFRIDETGTPTNIEFVRINCEEIRQKTLNLLENSSKWTRTNRNVRLRIRL